MVALAEARRVAIARSFIVTVVRGQVWDVLELGRMSEVVEWTFPRGYTLFLYSDLERYQATLRVKQEGCHLRI